MGLPKRDFQFRSIHCFHSHEIWPGRLGFDGIRRIPADNVAVDATFFGQRLSALDVSAGKCGLAGCNAS